MSALIDGVQVVPLRRIPDERGTILHMLRSTDEHFLDELPRNPTGKILKRELREIDAE